MVCDQVTHLHPSSAQWGAHSSGVKDEIVDLAVWKDHHQPKRPGQVGLREDLAWKRCRPAPDSVDVGGDGRRPPISLARPARARVSLAAPNGRLNSKWGDVIRRANIKEPLGGGSTGSCAGVRCCWSRVSWSCCLGVSLVGAAVSPGNVSFEAKWADWLRAHHAGLIAQKFEELYYSAIAPAKGGTPKGLNKVPVTVQAAPSTTRPSTSPLYEYVYDAPCDYHHDRTSRPPTAQARPPCGPPIARWRRQVAAHRPPHGRRARHVRGSVPGR